MPLMQLLMGKSDLWQQEAILFLCNNGSSKHWFPRVVFPQKRCIMIDSLPGVFIKSTALRREKEMMSFLQEVQPLMLVSCLSAQNKPGEIPEQKNSLWHLYLVSHGHSC